MGPVRRLVRGKEVDLEIKKVRILIAWIWGIWSLLFLGLVYLQVIKHDYFLRLSRRNFIRVVSLPAPRGDILDRKLRPLATSRLAFDVVINPRSPHREVAFELLSKLFSVKKKELERRYRLNYVGPYVPVVVIEDVPKKLAFEVEELKLIYPQVGIQVRPKRIYSYGPMLSHVIGYVRQMSRKQFSRLRRYGYNIRDRIGVSGVEREYEAYLRGKNGWIELAVDKLGRPVEVVKRVEPKKGTSIVLTIDRDLQEIVYSHLKGKVGAVVMMDPHSGEVLAMASWPSYDDNVFISGTSREISEIFSNPLSPLLNRAIGGTYPPGSTFKVVVATAGLDTGVITPRTVFDCPGYLEIGGARFGCAHVHGRENVVEALGHSCNVFFYRTGLLLGADRIYLYGSRFGFGEKTGIDLPGEKRGLLPSKGWKRKRFRQPWFDGDTLNFSIGQGFLLATPVQVLRMISAVVGSGKLVSPFVGMYAGRVRLNAVSERNLMIDERIFSVVRRGLEMAVEMRDGTARALYLPHITSVAGKTGTAQSQRGKPPHAWFVGYFPKEDPKYAVVVFLEYGKSSYYATVLLRGIIEEMAQKGFI